MLKLNSNFYSYAVHALLLVYWLIKTPLRVIPTGKNKKAAKEIFAAFFEYKMKSRGLNHVRGFGSKN
jgi:hypothetical protein